MNKKILDPCCGSRMFWFDKKNPEVLFADHRELNDILCDGRKLEIKPDTIMDFRKMPLESESFNLVVFDPPHLKQLGKNSWMAKKYGVLSETWENDIQQGFAECFRVLKKDGVLIFKWNETQIPVSKILELTTEKPLFGHKSGKLSNTHWICFMKSSMTEPYTNDFTYWHDHEVKFESQYSPSGVHITVYEKMSKEEQDDFKKHIKSERDVVTIKFK